MVATIINSAILLVIMIAYGYLSITISKRQRIIAENIKSITHLLDNLQISVTVLSIKDKMDLCKYLAENDQFEFASEIQKQINEDIKYLAKFREETKSK